MKIASIYTLYGRRAGAEMFFEKVVEHVRRLSPATEWVVFCNAAAEKVLRETQPGVETRHVPWLENQYKKAFWLEFLSGKALRAERADCFWVPSGCNHFPGRGWEIPAVSTFLDLGEYRVEGKYGFARTVFRKAVCIPRNVRRAARFTSISRSTREDMERFLGVAGSRVRVSYPGPSTHAGEPPGDSEEIIARLGLGDRSYLYTPGRTDFVGKGLDLMLEAYGAWRSGGGGSGIPWVLSGPQGESHERFLSAAGKNPWKADIRYLGRVDDATLAALYRHCLATVLPSRFEGFGFPVLEAMGHGVPVVCSDAGSLPEVAGNAAMTFRSGDARDLLEKLKGVAGNGELSGEAAAGARAERLAAFSWERCGREMLEEFMVAAGKKDNP